MVKLPPLRYWSPELELRQDIDKQHKFLIYQYERLENAIKEGHGYELLINIVLFLHQYALTHFQTEEREMLEYNYPEYGEHAEQHDLCKTRVFQFEYRMKTQPKNPENLKLAQSLLGHWVRDHILGFDKKFIEYVKENKNLSSSSKHTDKYHWTPEKSQIWTPDLSTGQESIDKQHQELIKWTEIVREAKDWERSDLMGIIISLQRFVMDHFTDEELFLNEIRYPELERHSSRHSEFRRRLVEIKRRSEKSPLERLRSEIGALLNSYVDHMKTEDMKYRNFILTHREGL